MVTMIRKITAFAVSFLLPACIAQAGPLKIDYTVAPRPAEAGELRTQVTVHVAGLKGEKSVRLQMAVWSPGDYHVMNHARFVRNVSAAYDPVNGEQSQQAVAHPDPNTWDVPLNGRDSVTVTYSLPNTPPGFFSDNVRVTSTFAFYNGPATYMYVVGHKTDPVTLHVALPAGWKQSYTPLATDGETSNAYAAPDYDTLADSPLVAGDFATREFTAVGRTHTLVFFDDHKGMNYDEFAPVLKKVVEEENRLMGGPPYARYGFFIDVNGGGGGLEHLNSCRVAWGKGFSPRFAAGFFGHEFFHLWDVKRIRPEVLGPFDYVNPPRTRNLWFCEGVTDYYSDMSVFRAGLTAANGGATPESRLYAGFAGLISGHQNNPAHRTVTADESSLRVFEAGNSDGYGGLSYYQKGKLIGLCLDLKLRALTEGKSSLDAVMRDMMQRYGLPKPGFPEDGIRDAVIRAGGETMGPFYDRLARSTEEMPFAECFVGIGLRLTGGNGASYRISPDPNAGTKIVQLREEWLTGK